MARYYKRRRTSPVPLKLRIPKIKKKTTKRTALSPVLKPSSKPIRKSVKRRRYRLHPEEVMVLGGIFIVGLIVLILIGRLIYGAATAIHINQKDIEAMRISPQEIAYIYEICDEQKTDPVTTLTVYCLYNDFFKEKQIAKTKEQIQLDFIPKMDKIKSKMSDKTFNKYFALMDTLMKEIKYFPIPISYGSESYTFSDSFNTKKDMCGSGNHKGADIYCRENIPGKLPVIAIASGTVEGRGKNGSGNWYIGIRSEQGTYYYYDHLDRISEALDIGMQVTAGGVLGYMGNGAKSEKSDISGHYPTNVHIGIKVNSTLKKSEFWVNPYPFLRYIEQENIDVE